MVAQLKQLQSETEPIVKMFEDPETTRQMQSTRSETLFQRSEYSSDCIYVSHDRVVWLTCLFCCFPRDGRMLFDYLSEKHNVSV